MQVLVDTSVWIDYFRSGLISSPLDILIDENLIVTNDVVLTELIPFLRVKKQTQVIGLLNDVTKLPLQTDWEELIRFQTHCLRSGRNGIGIPDLMIAQHAKQNKYLIYSLDKHFKFMEDVIPIDLYEI